MASNPSSSSSPISTDLEFSNQGCCSFFSFNCFRSKNWQRISTTDDQNQQQNQQRNNWWRKGIETVMKVREWSELVAGPKWKTFIRRFNKNGGRSNKNGKFQYDPFSYALNFDDGEGQNGQFDDDRVSRDFSSRYAAIKTQNSQRLNEHVGPL